ncbi:MAG TPA: RNA polymerase sigma factor [Gemmatimonadales bacterium]|nr:RNA polymerase sigma factor [Gemmatimonadales bacterium]
MPLTQAKELDDVVAPLLRRAQAGDAAARDELLGHCHATVYRWAVMHTGDADDAEDVAQEVLVRLDRSLGSYSGRARFTTWLYQVTRNASVGFGRRIASRLRLARGFARERSAIAPPAEDPVARLQESHIGRLVTGLFRRLPAKQREVFYLADIEGLGPQETAERLGMNPVTARAHLFRARRALRTWILEEHPEVAEER